MELVTVLHARGVNSDVRDDQGCSVLICAASSGNLEMVARLLELYIDPNRADNEGTTALSPAAEKDYEEVVQLTLQTHICNPNPADIDGGTPISWAAWNGHLGTVRILANHGTVPDWVDTRWGRTPLS